MKYSHLDMLREDLEAVGKHVHACESHDFPVIPSLISFHIDRAMEALKKHKIESLQ